MSYQLIDSGNGQKLERFGPYRLVRPAAQAVWEPSLSQKEWESAEGIFTREEKFQWIKHLAKEWNIEVSGLNFHLSVTDFGHLGLFPEQRPFWDWIQQIVSNRKKKGKKVRVLNLFAYSGAATLAAAKAGAEVCHLDASKGMVDWARENARLNHMEEAPIRWIIDDVMKFLMREQRRGSFYDGIILDPPTYGRGRQGQVFKIEEQIQPLLRCCRDILSSDPLFMLMSCHTHGFTPLVLKHLLMQRLEGLPGKFDAGEMILEGGKEVFPLPSGAYARWQNEE